MYKYFLLITFFVSMQLTADTITNDNSITGQNTGDTIGQNVVQLPNGNIVITSPGWSGERGAVTCLTPAEYQTGDIVISEANSLTGAIPGDNVGSDGVVVLSNGNYVVLSYGWNNESGAVTWVNGTTCNPSNTTGRAAVVSATNSLVGSTAYDFLVADVTVLANGNYLVRAPYWDNNGLADAGMAAWADGSAGIVGTINAANALVGTAAHDQVGYLGIAVNNGNYVIGSPDWNNQRGAATWGSGSTGLVGEIHEMNSLVGAAENDRVSEYLVALVNGNYLIISPNWNNSALLDAGAVTWGSGSTGVTGAINDSNSLVGTTQNDRLGSSGVTALTNGNYVVRSPSWDNSKGAATWGNGNGGTVGMVSSTNSLVGTVSGDTVSNSGVFALSNGNYVVGSNTWDNGAVPDAGASTWGDGNGGTAGVVSALNSLIGTNPSDYVGSSVVALNNGNYVVRSPGWNNARGAATWGNGSGGTVGSVSETNSLVGAAPDDLVSSGIDGGIWALSNGNYVVRSVRWDNNGVKDAGAVTWGNGSGGTVGVVNQFNSLVGTKEDDKLGIDGIQPLTNGHYVVKSSLWDNDKGAVTWGNGNGGTMGAVSQSNSLIGTTTGDFGSSALGLRVAALANGHYVITTPAWDNGTIIDAGAATWADGNTGITGTISASNSLVGVNEYDWVGNYGVWILSTGDYVVVSALWNNGLIMNAGAVTWGDSSGGMIGTISETNSLVGLTADDNVGSNGIAALNDGSYLVLSPNWTKGDILHTGAVTWVPTLNLLANGSFETADDMNPKLAEGWLGSNLTRDRRQCPALSTGIPDGTCVFRFRPDMTESSRIWQNVNLETVNLNAGDLLMLRGMFKSFRKPDLRMKLVIIYADGTRDNFTARIKQTAGYQSFELAAPLTSTPKKARVMLMNRTTNGKVFVDDLWLTATPLSTGFLPLPR